jgi:anti-sigma regulatory factor (Ser/Thr protein kinase)
VERVTASWQVDPKPVFRLRVCLAELAGNIVEHGGGDAGPIAVTLASEAEGLAADIVDGGLAFDPTTQPATPPAALADTTPSGRGLLTVHRLAQNLAYRRAGGRNHLHLLVPSPL